MSPGRPLRRSGGLRRALLGLWVAGALAACGTAGGVVATPAPTPPPAAARPPLVVQMVDVGQGDGLVVISPTGKIIMIDAGDRGKDRAMLAQLDADGVTEIDLAVMSHPHADHIGGMQKVLEKVPAKVFLDPGFDYSSGIYADLLAHLERSQTKVVIARQGRRIDIGGGAYFEVLWPREPLLSGTRSDANSNSVVLKLVYGETSMLFTGDSEAPTENGLLEDPEALKVDVLKVAHHGSEHSTQGRFLAAVRPRIAVISCGTDNKFGHPGLSTVTNLERAGAQVIRTDLAGTITLTSDGEAWTPAVERGALSAPVTAERGVLRRSGPTAPVAVGEAGGAAGLGDINTATASDLQAVEGVGPAKARAILEFREAHGPFRFISELTRVEGIGAKTASRIAEKFEVRGQAPVEDSEPIESGDPP